MKPLGPQPRRHLRRPRVGGLDTSLTRFTQPTPLPTTRMGSFAGGDQVVLHRRCNSHSGPHGGLPDLYLQPRIRRACSPSSWRPIFRRKLHHPAHAAGCCRTHAGTRRLPRCTTYPARTPQRIGSVTRRCLVIAFTSELVGRALHYASLARIGI